jgi:signal transduction histidine kinase
MASRLNLRFEERLLERTRIAGELHDTLLQGFLSASMQLDVATDGLPPDSPLKSRLNHILSLMSQVTEEGRNALQGLQLPDSNSLSLEQAFAQMEQEFAADTNGSRIEYSVAVEGWSQPLHPVFRDEVYRIGREAVTNALRHSGARSVAVELEYSARGFRLAVRDDGRGIDPLSLQTGRQRHSGLEGMRDRAERIGAQLRVWSRAEGGTHVEMSAPSHIAFWSHRRPERSHKIGSALRRSILELVRRPIWRK